MGIDTTRGHEILEDICKEVGIQLEEKPPEKRRNYLETLWKVLRGGLAIEISGGGARSEPHYRGMVVPFLGGVEFEVSEVPPPKRGLNIPLGNYNIGVYYTTV